MSKPQPPRYHTTNWLTYKSALERHGSLLILIDPEMDWLSEPGRLMGRPALFSDVAIQLCLSVKVLFKRPLRQVVGMVRAVLKLAGLDCPCRTTPPSAAARRHSRSRSPITGLTAPEPVGRKYGDQVPRRRRMACSRARPPPRWIQSLPGNSLLANRERGRKVHLAMVTATSDIRAVEFTSSWEGDSPTLPALPDQIPEDEQIGSMTADGAYDRRRCHNAVLEH